jgi:DNA-binding MarR family transcriptional regulator
MITNSDKSGLKSVSLPTLSEIQATRGPLPASLSIWTGYLFGRASQQCRVYFDSLVEPLGIQGRHFGLLAVLGEGIPLSQVDLGDRLGIDRNTIVLLLDDLQSLSLVFRDRDPRDRRAHLVTLTDKGRGVLERSTEMARRTNEEVLSPLSSNERRLLHDLMSKLF